MQDHFLIRTGMTWLGKIKLRAAVFVIGVPLAVAGAISVGPAWLALPLVGVAVAAITVSLNKVTSRLDQRVCWTCGCDLSSVPEAEQGLVCPTCGSLHQHNPVQLALGPGESDLFDDADDDQATA